MTLTRLAYSIPANLFHEGIKTFGLAKKLLGSSKKTWMHTHLNDLLLTKQYDLDMYSMCFIWFHEQRWDDVDNLNISYFVTWYVQVRWPHFMKKVTPFIDFWESNTWPCCPSIPLNIQYRGQRNESVVCWINNINMHNFRKHISHIRLKLIKLCCIYFLNCYYLLKQNRKKQVWQNTKLTKNQQNCFQNPKICIEAAYLQPIHLYIVQRDESFLCALLSLWHGGDRS